MIILFEWFELSDFYLKVRSKIKEYLNSLGPLSSNVMAHETIKLIFLFFFFGWSAAVMEGFQATHAYNDFIHFPVAIHQRKILQAFELFHKIHQIITQPTIPLYTVDVEEALRSDLTFQKCSTLTIRHCFDISN